MPLSYRNSNVNINHLLDNLASGNFNNLFDKKPSRTNEPRYIKGYANDSAIESLSNLLGINSGLFKQMFGLENKKLDPYDPYNVTNPKREDFWSQGNEVVSGQQIQKTYDEDTNTFKRGLYSQYGYRDEDFWYEDPFIPSFELYFDENSPFFAGDNSSLSYTKTNSLKYFLQTYGLSDGLDSIDLQGYLKRFELWNEFKNVFFKIFQKNMQTDITFYNKPYYISKISGLNNLNKKIINYGEDKISITLNEDVSLLVWYIAELYNNLVYSYKNQRFAFPENLLRFDMKIKINDIRNFQIPINNSTNKAGTVSDDMSYKNIKYNISPKSEIMYTLHDCNFNFFESRNYGEDLTIGGYGGDTSNTPQSLTFDIFYKSVSRNSEFPLIKNSISINTINLNQEKGSDTEYYKDLNRIKAETVQEPKGYLSKLIGGAGQSVANNALNYLDNLETKLREKRGNAINDLLLQFRDTTNLDKIEPDNVYNPDFNDRTSLKNLGRRIVSDLQTELEDAVRNGANF